RRVRGTEPYDYLEMKLLAKEENVSVARLREVGIAKVNEIHYEENEELKNYLFEVITKAVIDAHQEKNEIKKTIGYGLYEERVEVMVADHGGSFKLSEIKGNIGPYKDTEPVETLRESGFGLFLINALMDKVEINNNHGVIVLMTKYLGETKVGFN